MRIFLIASLCGFALAGVAGADQPEGAKTATKVSSADLGMNLDGTLAQVQSPSGISDSGSGKRPAQNDAGQDPSAEISDVANSTRQRQGSLNEVVVTAERYSEVAYNVPIHLTILDTQDLRRLDIDSIGRLKFFVPGMSTNDIDTQTAISIDGVANVQGTGSEVSEYLDDADVTPSPDLYSYNVPDYTFYDLKRVEVLRGPQGTLYGEGAEGGAIHFVTNRPNLTTFESELRTQALFTAGGLPSQRVYPVFNFPMSATFGVRIAGQYSHDGGWIDDKTAAVKGINASDLAETRLEALWQLSQRFNVNLTQVVHNRKFAPQVGESTNGTYFDPVGLYEIPQASENMYLTNVDVNYAILGVATLTSSTTWLKSASITNGVSSAEPASFGSLAYKWLENAYRYQHYSEEMRLHHSGSGPWQWVVGGLFKRVAVNSFPTTFCGLPFGTPMPVSVPPYLNSPPSFGALIFGVSETDPSVFCLGLGQKLQSRSSSEYASGSYDIARKMTVSVGVRNFRDEEKAFAAGGTGWQSATFTSIDPSVSVLYRLTNHLNVYARAAKGFRSGGFNGFGVSPFGPESLWNYSLGVKTRQVFGLSASAEAYYTRWNDVQNYARVQYGTLTVSLVQTGGAVRIKGGNVAIQWQPTTAWQMSVSGDYVNSRWVALGGTNAASGVGDPVDYVPRYQMNVSVQRDWAADFYGAKRPVYLRVDYSQQAPWAFRNRTFGFYVVGDHLYMMDVEAGIEWKEGITFGIEAKNILNDRGFVDGDTEEEVATRVRPMTVGVYFDTRFD